VKVDLWVILTIDEDITEYHRELKLIVDLQKEVKVIHTNNTDYAQHIVSLEDVGMASGELDCLMQGNHKFSI
jgi:hypothetical protein